MTGQPSTTSEPVSTPTPPACPPGTPNCESPIKTSGWPHAASSPKDSEAHPCIPPRAIALHALPVNTEPQPLSRSLPSVYIPSRKASPKTEATEKQLYLQPSSSKSLYV